MDINLIRASVVVLLALSIGAVFSVLRLHYLAIRTLKPKVGLTPLHVFLVSLGVLMIQVGLAWALIESLSTGAPAQTPGTVYRYILFGIGSVIILVALYVVGGLQRKRIQFARTANHTVIVETVKRESNEIT